MLWGDRKRFAIEADFEDSSGKWRFGKLMMWLGGRPLGDYEDTTDLASAGRWGRTFLSASGRRTRPELESLAAEEVFHELFQKYFERNPNIKGSLSDNDACILDEIGEASIRDRATILAFRQADGSDRMIAHLWKTEETWALTLEPGQLDQIIDQFCRWTETL